MEIEIKQGESLDKIYNNEELCNLMNEDNVFIRNIKIIIEIK